MTDFAAIKRELEQTTISGAEYVRRGRPATGYWGAAYKLMQEPAPPPPPPPPVADKPWFNGDFSTGDLSQWKDFHDAHLPQGVQVVKPGLAKFTVTGAADSSTGGDATYLWHGGNYDLPWLSKGAEAWFRTKVLLPDGSDPAYPGVFTPSKGTAQSGPWDMLMEWHAAPGAGYSSYFGVAPNDPRFYFRTCGGPVSSLVYKGAKDTQPFQFNRLYDVLVHLVFDEDPAVGFAECWVDDRLLFSAHAPTLGRRSDGRVPGSSLQIGLYRGPQQTRVDTVYSGGVVAGPTRESVA